LVRGISAGEFAKALAGSAVLAVLIAVVGSNALDFMDDYVARLVKTQEDIETLSLVGSEGSRANAVLALPEYWESAGMPGFLFGTGYANYEEWLLSVYGDLQFSSFAQGAIDSILVAVVLSTGLLGVIAYLAFLANAFGLRVIKLELPLVIFILVVNFAYGQLISGMYWNLLFVLASVARFSVKQRAKEIGLAGPRGRFGRRQGSQYAAE
jgi:hypothetical protein